MDMPDAVPEYIDTAELRFDPEVNKAVMFRGFAAFYDGRLTNEEKLELREVYESADGCRRLQNAVERRAAAAAGGMTGTDEAAQPGYPGATTSASASGPAPAPVPDISMDQGVQSGFPGAPSSIEFPPSQTAIPDQGAVNMKELRFDPEIDEVVTFSEFAYFHGNQLSEEEKIELWFQNELAIGVAADFPEDDDIANDVGDGFGLGLGSSDKGSPGLMCVLVNDEFGQCAKQCVEVASESAAGTASSSTLDEIRAAMNELHAAMLQISFVFPQPDQPDAQELHTVIDELHVVMLQISFRDRGIGTACA